MPNDNNKTIVKYKNKNSLSNTCLRSTYKCKNRYFIYFLYEDKIDAYWH
jgi:hypothetical protein